MWKPESYDFMPIYVFIKRCTVNSPHHHYGFWTGIALWGVFSEPTQENPPRCTSHTSDAEQTNSVLWQNSSKLRSIIKASIMLISNTDRLFSSKVTSKTTWNFLYNLKSLKHSETWQKYISNKQLYEKLLTDSGIKKIMLHQSAL